MQGFTAGCNRGTRVALMRGASRHRYGRLFYNGPVVLRGLTRQFARICTNRSPWSRHRASSPDPKLPPKRAAVGVWSIQATFSPANMNRLAKILPIENVVVGLSVT